MAYEASEILTAHALRYPSSYLKKITTYEQLTTLIAESVANHNTNKRLNAGQIQFADAKTRTGFGSQLDYENLPSVAKQILRVGDMAIGVSAALAIRGYVKSPAGKITTYITGVKWPTAVSHFKVNAFGFADYNSSDMMITTAPGKVDDKSKNESTTKKMYYGISLKKKKTVSASNPTLINKAVSSLFDGKEYDEMKEKIVNVRVKYFADLVREATETKPPIIRQKDIGTDWSAKSDNGGSNDIKLMKAPNKNVKIFGPKGSKGKTYIDTKGYYGAPKGGYISGDGNITKDKKSMRYFVNKKLDWTMKMKSHPLWSEYVKAIESPWKKRGETEINIKGGAEKLAEDLLNIILKLKLYDQLDAKGFKRNKFQFALITGIGEVKSLKTGIKVSIDSAKVFDLKTTLCGMSRINEKNKGAYSVKFDKVATEGAEAAKIFFNIMKGTFNIMSLRIRYKGKFNPKPQFQANMTDGAVNEFQQQCSR